MMTLLKLNKSIINCQLCSRLVAFREKIAKEKRRQYINEILLGQNLLQDMEIQKQNYS